MDHTVLDELELLQNWPSEESFEMGNVHCSSSCTGAEEQVVSNGLICNIDSNVYAESSNNQRSGTKTNLATRRERMKRVVTDISSKVNNTLDRLLFVDDVPPTQNISRKVHGGILLHECDTPEEHFDRHDIILETMKDCQLKSDKGLKAAGLQFELKRCSNCLLLDKREGEHSPENDERRFVRVELDGEVDSMDSLRTLKCEDCHTRLVHSKSGIMIEHHNRRKFIADGEMYDEVSRCCMEYAQDMMINDYGMKWITIDHENEGDPIRALVSKTHPAAGGSSISRPTLLIITGKGKVGAGIFSRQHIQTTGIEPSTALFTIKEAQSRNMNVVMLDPNANGERMSYIAIEKSMSKIFDYIENSSDENSVSQYPLLIQAHSAAGGNIVRYLMDKSECYLQHLQAIAFTDSTHNVQWVKNQPQLAEFLESSAAIYFRSSKNDYGYSQPHPAGEDMSPDANWIRRFGNIRTCWAGTTEHSLSDWSARRHIWDHFDKNIDLEQLEN